MFLLELKPGEYTFLEQQNRGQCYDIFSSMVNYMGDSLWTNFQTSHQVKVKTSLAEATKASTGEFQFHLPLVYDNKTAPAQTT